MEKPNETDPSLVDVYDDTSGEYVTTYPKPDPVADPMTGAPVPEPTPATAEQQAHSDAVLTDPARALTKGVRTGTTDVEHPGRERAPGVTTVDPAKPSMQPGAADSQAGLLSMQPGHADMIAGSEGGLQVTKTESKGLEHGPELIQGVNDAADQERGAVLDESLARETQLMDDEKRQAEMETKIKQQNAENAIQQKLIMDRRAKVEQRIAAVSAEQPDRNRTFPTGWNLVATFAGAIAGGMLQGLQGGSNPVLDALNHRLDLDVQQQRETQSTQIKDLARQLGSMDAAEDILRAKQKEVVLKEVEARLLGGQNKVAPAQIQAFRSRMNAEITRHKIDAISKLDRDLTIQEVNTPATAARTFNAESFRATELQKYASENGVKPKDAIKEFNTWSKGAKDRTILKAGLDAANRAIAKYESTNDVAGLGPLAKFIPNSINSSDAVAVRQVLGSITAQYLKQMSGATVSEPEFERTLTTLQGAGDYDSVKRGLGLVGQGLRAQEEEDAVNNPAFQRISGTIRQMNSSQRVQDQPGRAQQAGQVGDIVSIPRTARIAYEHNNPGNLTFKDQRGATRGEPKDGGGYWARFDNTSDGMRALARQVGLDQERGLNVRQFVEKYAPKKDGNDVDMYLQKLHRLTGADEETNLSEISAGSLAFALAAIESGARPTK